MASSRLFPQSFLSCEHYNSISVFARDFFVRLWTHADDFGRDDARPVMLRTQLYPLLLDKVGESDIERALLECERASLVRPYSVNGRPYLEILNYNQRIRTKSKYPDPPTIVSNLLTIDSNLPQPADSCQQSAATCGQLSATCRNLPQSAAQTETNTETETNTKPLSPSTTRYMPRTKPTRHNDCNANRRYDW